MINAYALNLLLAVFSTTSHAFPSALLDAAARDPTLLKRAEEIYKRQSADEATALFEPVPIFDAGAQYVNVSKGSGHEYVAPGPNDLRGPCPGLNAFANHSTHLVFYVMTTSSLLTDFLPHNGYATVAQYIEATNSVVGMGPNLALFLSVYGGAIDGDILSWSMGGRPSLAQGGVTGILANGLIGSHNKYEGDGSPTRPDQYEAGNNYKTVVKQFQELIDYSPDGVITMDTLTKFRSHRYDTQVQNNPHYFMGPFSGVLVQPAAYTFIYRFMANHSKDDPAGRLDYKTVQSWFGIEGESGSYTAVQGGERIPDNWVRTSHARLM